MFRISSVSVLMQLAVCQVLSDCHGILVLASGGNQDSLLIPYPTCYQTHSHQSSSEPDLLTGCVVRPQVVGCPLSPGQCGWAGLAGAIP